MRDRGDQIDRDRIGQALPLDFALLNWAFVPLYVAGRLWPRAGSARVAMWFAVVAMALPNVMLFALAPTMISGAFDAGQGIGVIESLFLWSPIQMIPGITAIMIDASTEVFFILGALTGFLPLVGLIAWLLGQFAGHHVDPAGDLGGREADRNVRPSGSGTVGHRSVLARAGLRVPD